MKEIITTGDKVYFQIGFDGSRYEEGKVVKIFDKRVLFLKLTFALVQYSKGKIIEEIPTRHLIKKSPKGV